ncbi:EsaB/YukD family protein [Mycolicibacterium palauense]|uniref:EsaB/YukD family protein n=1 Tax=Mycolicibacterium palauense TaxID=2034511 RepID=UPI00159BCC6A|nr:EsaB/YukD family protein [Mycolicibacterium palauense]
MLRVSIHADATHADLALPEAVPLADLLPAITDLMVAHGCPRPTGAPTLSEPGSPPLTGARSLTEQGIREGAVLLLADPDPPPHGCTGGAGATGRGGDSARPGPPRWAAAPRAVAALAAVLFAAGAGAGAVPGPPGLPGLLLGAAGAGTAAAAAARLTDCGRTPLTVFAAVCGLVAAAAALGTVFALPLHRAAVVLAAVSVALLPGAGRLAVLISGLTRCIPADLGLEEPTVAPDPGAPDAGATDAGATARRAVAITVSATAAASALGVTTALLAAPAAPAPMCLAAAVTAALALRVPDHDQMSTRVSLSGAAVLCAATLVAVAANGLPGPGPWLVPAGAAVAALLGVARGPIPPPAAGRRWPAATGYLALAAVAPSALWALGCYGAARGLSLP